MEKCIRRKEQQGKHMRNRPQPCTALWGAGGEIWSEIKPGKKGEVEGSFLRFDLISHYPTPIL